MTNLFQIARRLDPSLFWKAGVVLILLLAFGLRMLDLTDPPLDFHPTAQLLNAITARGMYYQMDVNADQALRDAAISMLAVSDVYEPRILSGLVALTYLLIGQEQVWIARIYSSAFWVIAGLGLYWLAARLVSRRAALLSTAYFLFLPFAIIASRTFQTSSLMIMLLVLTLCAFVKWNDTGTWKWALTAGLLAGLTVLAKITMVFQVALLAVILVLGRYHLGQALRQAQVWVMAFLSAFPAFIYYLLLIPDNSSGYFRFWAVQEWPRLLDPGHYVRWMTFLNYLVELPLLFLALLSTLLLAAPRTRSLLLGLWGGFFIYGLFFPYHMFTHEYYNLPIVPVIALALSPISEHFFERLERQTIIWRVLGIAVLLVWIAYPAWVGRSTMMAADYRHEPGVWRNIGQAVPQDGKVIALTQDYGMRLMYYGWLMPNRLWPLSIDISVSATRGASSDVQAYFEQHTAGMRYFLVTAEGKLRAQRDLHDILYGNYTLIASGDSYLIFDLEQSLVAEQEP
jgi:4-amino-4-deoxy-L-arabinose transferase-like glycosyltransferase